MSVVSQCPNELWLEILQYIPRDQLLSISSTNRLLRQLTLHLLFSCFQVRLHIPRPGRKWDGYQRNPILDPPASIDRMRFWMSPAIAPLVRSCTAGSGSAEYINCPTQVNFFLTNLHTLTRLRSLSLWEISIDLEGLATLHQLPCLAELSVDCCKLDVHLPRDDDEESFDENNRVPLLRLSKLSIFRSTIAQFPCFYPDWMLVVDAVWLRDLTLGCDYNDYDFSTIGASNLRMVERLFVWPDGVRELATFLPGTLPMLREFAGPAQIARQLLACSPVERLTLSFDEDNALDEILSGTPPARNVLALHLSIFVVDIACVDPVLRLFPNITELSAWIDLYELTKKALHSQIWKTVRQIAEMAPPALVLLSLTLNVELESARSWHYADEWSEDDGSDDFDFSSSAEYPAFIAEARTRFAGLKDLWIDIDSQRPVEYFTVHWRQHPGGQVSEEVAKNPASVERMRRMKEST
ncbi:hypothetical protein C8F01DRAFT_1339350 [Mycena amicta]|nr:hypothetical protein C8F01DRAFT_1339350 [Mycena amicta]